jgi:hypothetical protein
LFINEFKPAYDAIYYYSPYIASLEESGYSSLSQINNDVNEFRRNYTRGHKNDLLTFYNEGYQLVYYKYTTGTYEILPNYNMLEDLGLTGTPTTE